MVKSFDVIVVGLGAMGAAATYQLAKSGARVLGLDQYAHGHRRGSSHGETRMTRVACGEGSIFTKLAQRSHQLWREIEDEFAIATGISAHEKLLTLNGQLLIDGPGASEGHGEKEFLKTTAKLAKDAGIAHELLSSAKVRSRFPAFALTHDERAYFDNASGFVRPEVCIEAQLFLAQRRNATTRFNERALTFTPSAGGIKVRTSEAEYLAKNVILTAGPWLPDFLPAPQAATLEVQRQILFWFALKRDRDLSMFRPAHFPAFAWFKRKPRLLIYGFPALGSAAEGIKLATESSARTTPDRVDRSVSRREKTIFYDTYVRDSFPALSDRCVKAEVCLYTVEKRTRKRFIIDRHPSMENVLCVSACSGHGFKHSAAVGELLAEMVTEGKSGPPQFAWDYAGDL